MMGESEALRWRVVQAEHENKTIVQDMEFVKSLWRQVQVDHKDLAAVVTMVMERETRKIEEKDQHVLEILQDKDDIITELNKEIEFYKESIELHKEDETSRLKEWQDKEEGLLYDVNDLQEQLALANIALADPSRQKCDEVMIDALGAMDQGKVDLEKQLSQLKRDLRSCSKQVIRLKRKHEEQSEENKSLRNLIVSHEKEADSFKLIICELQDGLKEKNKLYLETYDALKRVRRDAVEAVTALEKSEELHRRKDDELTMSRKETKEINEAHSSTIDRMHHTITSLESRVKQLVTDESKYREECISLRNTSQCTNCDEMKSTLDEEKGDNERNRVVLASIKTVCEDYLNRSLSMQDLPDAADILVSDVRCKSDEAIHCTKLIQQLQLASKDKQTLLTKLQTVHDERLYRMNTLQEHLSEVLDELKCQDIDRWKELCCPLTQQAPQPLRHEDSSTVWNDLAFYKQRSNTLQRQLHQLQEDHSKLSLQCVVDQSALSDMKTALLEDQRVAQDKLRRVNHRTICGCNLQLDVLKDKVESLGLQTEQLNSENIHLLASLHTEQAKRASLEQCRCDMIEVMTQTLPPPIMCSVGSMTHQLIEDKENIAPRPLFSNTLNMLDKLTTKAPIQPRQEMKIVEKKKTKPTYSTTCSTQTLPVPKVKVVQKAPPATKIRLASLNQQVAVLTKAKHNHARILEQERSKVKAAEQSLSAALRQVTSSQMLISSLNEDVRVAQEDTAGLREEISDLQNSALRQSELLVLNERNVEIKKLNHQNKLLSSQISIQSSSIDGLKKEIDGKGLEIITLEDKLHRSDKSNKQLRSDLNNNKHDNSTAKSEVKVISDKLNDTLKRLKQIQVVSDNRKKYIETLKSQLEKSWLDHKQVVANFDECKTLLDVKSRQLRDASRKQEGAATAITNIETYATKQLEEQGTEFCKIEKELNGKIKTLSKRTFQWEKCIKQVVSDLVSKIKKEKDKRLVANSLSNEDYNRAKQLSSSILNLSEADFHDIMSSTRVSAGGDTSSIWKAQLARILDLDDFGPVLCNSLLQLFDELVRVMMGEPSPQSTQSSISLVVSDVEITR